MGARIAHDGLGQRRSIIARSARAHSEFSRRPDRPQSLAASARGHPPHIRIGKRWINVLWAIPIGAVGLVLLIALAQSLRELPGIQTPSPH